MPDLQPSRPMLAISASAIAIAVLVMLYWDSFRSMWFIWGDSNTYTHGYVIFPLAVYLIWLNREKLVRQSYTASYAPSFVILLLGVIWVVSYLFHIDVLGHFSVIAMLIAIVPAVFGCTTFLSILFPLLYLFFAVPMGEGLVPSLMEFTADFTVWALTASGIPVYREGMYFSIPAGDFEVAKACSGIRYLMASFALGTLFAYLTFTSTKKRIIFCIFSLVLPIIANGIRAYGIVMIAHLSQMKYAVGVDHILYGWVFFGVVIFLMFFVGNYFRDEPLDEQSFEQVSSRESHGAFRSASRSAALEESQLSRSNLVIQWMPVLWLFTVLVVPYLLLQAVLRDSNRQTIVYPVLPKSAQGWIGPSTHRFAFTPYFNNYIASDAGMYEYQGEKIYVWVYRYQPFVRDKEMITETNILVDPLDWDVLDQKHRMLENLPELSGVYESKIRRSRVELLAWHWYQFDHYSSANRIRAKLLEGWSWLRGGLRGELNFNESIWVIASPGLEQKNRALMQLFLETHLSDWRSCQKALRSTDQCISTQEP